MLTRADAETFSIKTFIVRINTNLISYNKFVISAKITLFYIVYYTFLTAFFIAMLLVFFTTLKDDRPTWTMEDGGLIGSNPAMGFRPTPSEDNVESTLIWFRNVGT